LVLVLLELSRQREEKRSSRKDGQPYSMLFFMFFLNLGSDAQGLRGSLGIIDNFPKERHVEPLLEIWVSAYCDHTNKVNQRGQQVNIYFMS